MKALLVHEFGGPEVMRVESVADPVPGDGTLPHTLLHATDPAFGLGDWNKIQTDFFAEGGVFDQIYQSGR